jgi:hypothetical protein
MNLISFFLDLPFSLVYESNIIIGLSGCESGGSGERYYIFDTVIVKPCTITKIDYRLYTLIRKLEKSEQRFSYCPVTSSGKG